MYLYHPTHEFTGMDYLYVIMYAIVPSLSLFDDQLHLYVSLYVRTFAVTTAARTAVTAGQRGSREPHDSGFNCDFAVVFTFHTHFHPLERSAPRTKE